MTPTVVSCQTVASSLRSVQHKYERPIVQIARQQLAHRLDDRRRCHSVAHGSELSADNPTSVNNINMTQIKKEVNTVENSSWWSHCPNIQAEMITQRHSYGKEG